MSPGYQKADAPYFDYTLAPFPGAESLLVRGPIPDFDKPFIACIGAAQTFGRFCHAPFPMLLALALDVPTLNLGLGGAGPRTFVEPAVLDAINQAKLVIVQVLSGRSASNSCFDNTSHGHHVMGVRRSDERLMRFETFLRELIETESPETLGRVIEDTRTDYLDAYRALLAAIRPPRILHWFSIRAPDMTDDFANARSGGVWEVLGAFPQLVNRPMVETLQNWTDAYVETISAAGLPQRLWASAEPVDGTQFVDGYVVNGYYPSQAMHARAAGQLAPVCEKVMPELDAGP